jgi:hypothetical protein
LFLRFKKSGDVLVKVQVWHTGRDTDVVSENVTKKLGEMLPGAYQGMVFSGKCQDLPKLQGNSFWSLLKYNQLPQAESDRAPFQWM